MSHMNKIEINDDVIVRYLTGNAEPEEAMAVMDWLKSSENNEHFRQFEETWLKSGELERPQFSKQDAWKRVSSEMHVPEAGPIPAKRTSLWPWGVAAIFIVLALSAYFLFQTTTPVEEPVQLGKAATTDSFRFIELSDRSAVTLHRNSELQYPDKFEASDRRVLLTKGEAFFNITSQSGKPFVVEAEGVTITVLGTEFNVQVEESGTTVHVREGRVLVRSASDSVTLSTGLTATVMNGNIAVTDVPAGNLYSYATQRLVFDDATLAQVIHDLEDCYPYTFELRNPSLENCRITANFYKDDIDKIVNLVAETLNLTVLKNGRHFTLEGEGCL